MKWLLSTLCTLLLVLPNPVEATHFYSTRRKRELRHLAHETWKHAYGSYKRVAFPSDELLPLSCRKQGHDRINPDNVGVNDVMGDYALTLVDSLDTFAMLDDKSGFEQAVRETIQHVSFDVDSRVQVFEVTIRMMGGLLSGHLLALDPNSTQLDSNYSSFSSSITGFSLPWYRGELLELALDLGTRLLPAFVESPTGIPFARIHLQKGLRGGKGGKGESGETCSAGAGSLLLEFITLSRLTNLPIFEQVAKHAFFQVWNLRSSINLIGNTLDVRKGQWLHGVSSIGAGIDSFFEYAAKAYVLTGEEQYWHVWQDSYEAIKKYLRAQDGFWYRGVNMFTGQLSAVHVDSLSAFFPGVQVLMGDLEGAIKSHGVYAFLWDRYGGIPELFDTFRKQTSHAGYPLRPEFIESNLYLYQATKDDYYLSVAEQILHDLNNRTRVECGFAAVLDLDSGKLEDKMPSFVTSETLKYLYLTFVEDSPFLRDDAAFVFTTEGHPLEIPRSTPNTQLDRTTEDSTQQPTTSTRESPPVCPAHEPLYDDTYQHTLSLSVDTRTDWEHARLLVGHENVDERLQIRDGRWLESGYCELSHNEDVPIELLFAANQNAEVLIPLPTQLVQNTTTLDVTVFKINGLRFSLAKAPGGGKGHGYFVSQIGPYKIPQDRYVIIRDPTVLSTLQTPSSTRIRPEKLKLDAVVTTSDEPPFNTRPDSASSIEGFLDRIMHPLGTAPIALTGEPKYASEPITLEMNGLAANFGPSISSPNPVAGSFAIKNPALPITTSRQLYGCEPHHPSKLVEHANIASDDHVLSSSESIEGKVVLLHRGVCSFALKSNLAALSGAKGVIVINDRDTEDIVPSASAADEDEATMKSLVPMVLIGNRTGAELEHLVHDRKPGQHVWIRIRYPEPNEDDDDDERAESVEGLMLGGYMVRNVKLGKNRGDKKK
ncbi:alpha-1,2-mannosidase MNL1 [Sporobolomyces koalae]|uniref:alpha-1,2-mannosidase MNL1 n=1 Tax=Sporobolomyces koalae TaxID=500713 RepID=UPI00318064FB